jgi:antitoxin component YwqK of YwqJK toxin-antitoxin module
MLEKKYYANGQKIHELDGDRLTFYFKNGKIKAEGQYLKEMEGEWRFYRETGQLWQIGNFKNGKKNGLFIRYDRSDKIEYQESFENGKIIKQK